MFPFPEQVLLNKATVDGFDSIRRTITIQYDKMVPMPMVAIGDKVLVYWNPEQRQDALTAQLADLYKMANAAKMYDAADYIERALQG